MKEIVLKFITINYNLYLNKLIKMKKVLPLAIFIFIFFNNAIAETTSSKCEDPETSKSIICKIKNMFIENNENNEMYKKQYMETQSSPLKMDFICYNSCKERNNESFCMKKCAIE